MSETRPAIDATGDEVAISSAEASDVIAGLTNFFTTIVTGLRGRLAMMAKMLEAQGAQLASVRAANANLEGIIVEGKKANEALLERLNMEMRSRANAEDRLRTLGSGT